MAKKRNERREEIYNEVRLSLGEGIIDLEIDNKHIDFALDYALKEYRQKAANATEEKAIIFKYGKHQQEYDMSDSNIADIQAIYRNTIGSSAATDYSMDPFLMMYVNQMMHALNQNMTYGSIATVHMQYHYIDQLEKIVASRIQFYWNPSTQVLTILNNVARDEIMTILADIYRTDEELLDDYNIKPWLLSYTIARTKYIMGEARSKFQSIAGPGGGITLNGNELKQEAQSEIEALETELANFVTSDRGYGIHTG
ncbi:hypothetical protein PBI_SCTP2_266 [Salicola phage SCTP-2]|nr:hypothetical protein PBI_SCTP2_266 [Salicola phage SCTP-2]